MSFTTTNISTIPAEIPRDRFDRPMVRPPNGGKPVPYTRCTTYVGCLEDTWNLSNWSQRNVAIGLSHRPDLLLATSAHRDDKTKLQRICDDAKEAAAAHAGATTGTALHTLTEKVDRGVDPGLVPASALADIAAYVEATKDMLAEHIEAFCVLDMLKVGGTPDRIVRWQGQTGLLTKGERYISDLKTGRSLDFGAAKMAMQLAVYSRSWLYDIASGERSPHGAKVDKGIIVHLPAGTGECTVYVIDLLRGWEGVRTAKVVREWRSNDKRDTFLTPVAQKTTPADQLVDAIATAVDVDTLTSLWQTHRDQWTDIHSAAAKVRKATLTNTQEGERA